MTTDHSPLSAETLLAAARLVAGHLVGPERQLRAEPVEQWAVSGLMVGAKAVVTQLSGAQRGQLALLVDTTALPAPGDAAAPALGALLPALEPVLAELVAALGSPAGAPGTTPWQEVDPAVAAAGEGNRCTVGLYEGERLVVAIVATTEVAEPVFRPLADTTPARIDSRQLHLLRDVSMGVSVELGRTRMTVRELLGLAPGAIVELDRAAGSPVDVLVNGTLIARGEVVVVDEEFAVRIAEIVSGDDEGRLGA